MASADLTLFSFSFMMRPNAFYRPKIYNLIHESLYQHSNNTFNESSTCIAVHIRRGDRIRLAVSMLEWCANVTHDEKVPKNEKWGCKDFHFEKLVLKQCPSLGDASEYGCHTVPYGAIELKHVVEKVPFLVNSTIRDLLVFTDDPLFLEEQKVLLREIDPSWRIHSLRYPKLPEDADMNKYHNSWIEYDRIMKHIRHRAGTESGVYLQASFIAARQCHGFIGHFGSKVSEYFYKSMCVEHGGRFGVCPPMYDFSTGL